MIVVGGSLGGFQALHEILVRLPAAFSLPIAAVLHRHRDSDDLIARALQSDCPLPVREVEDKEPIVGGRVYVCPADYHLLIDQGCFALSTDEPVNCARPSIDVLFESAAEWKQREAIAVVLTGAGSDGAYGAASVHARGGAVLVQDPATAEGPWMPAAAKAAVPAARTLTLAQIAEALIAFAAAAPLN